MATSVITRFAPSPTGFLHIGSARTALFNWLFARRMGGKFLLRIEDTDRERSTQPAITAILEGLQWLELNWDESVHYQFSRAKRHQSAAQNLLEAGLAYRCYASAEELEEMRAQARALSQPPRYDGRWRDRSPQECAKMEARGLKPTIRLKLPKEGTTIIEDKVQGRVCFPNKDLDDFVLLRSDGIPTYMLAVVVDDHDMGITHILRGDDHLTNAARQFHIYQAFKWEMPIIAHIPLIHGPDGAKLSKRHGALGVDAYRRLGYLPIALRNYLVRLGWSHGDQEFFSPEEMIAAFDLPHIGRAPSRFDFAKLEHMNGHYLRSYPPESLTEIFRANLKHMEGGEPLEARWNTAMEAKFIRAMPGLQERSKTLVELLQNAYYLFGTRPLTLEPEAVVVLQESNPALLPALSQLLKDISSWQSGTLEKVVRQYSEASGIKLGKIAQPLRAVLTGRLASPGIFDVLEVLGKEESLARISDYL